MGYRNQSETMKQIQMMAQLRITNAQEAIAFLRAMRPIQDQISGVLQRSGLRQQHMFNRVTQAQEAKEVKKEEPVTETPEPTPTFVPEDLSSDEGHSEEEVKEKVSKLKAAKKK